MAAFPAGKGIDMGAGLKLWTAVAAALLGLVAAASPSPVGTWRLHDGPDMASELLIRPDGTFAYFLAAGALDEQAKGRWVREGDCILLTTAPTPKPAQFAAGAVSKISEAPLRLKVVSPRGEGIPGVDLVVGFAAGEPAESYTQEYGWELSPDEKRQPTWVQFAIPMYGLLSPRFAIDAGKANDLTFVLTPNDLGIPDFEGLQLDVESDRLVMHRGTDLLSYVREKD